MTRPFNDRRPGQWRGALLAIIPAAITVILLIANVIENAGR